MVPSPQSHHPPPLTIQTSSPTSTSQSQLIQTSSVTSSAALISCSSSSSGSTENNGTFSLTRAVSAAAAGVSATVVVGGGSRTSVCSSTLLRTGETTVDQRQQQLNITTKPEQTTRSVNEGSPLTGTARATAAAQGLLQHQPPPSAGFRSILPQPPSFSSSSSSSCASSSTPRSSSLKRFLTTLYHFTCDISPEVGEKVHTLILGLVVRFLSLEDESSFTLSSLYPEFAVLTRPLFYTLTSFTHSLLSILLSRGLLLSPHFPFSRVNSTARTPLSYIVQRVQRANS